VAGNMLLNPCSVAEDEELELLEATATGSAMISPGFGFHSDTESAPHFCTCKKLLTCLRCVCTVARTILLDEN
jgi:hypothetical protein